VAVKQMIETKILEDEQTEVSELNSVIFAQKQELEAKLAEESQQKMVSTPLISLFLQLDHARVNSKLNVALSYGVQGTSHGSRCRSR
jgi:hypothetical protein